MRVCLDTNVLVQVFTPRSPFNEIREGLVDGRLTLLVSTEILFEYEEVITNELGIQWWRKLIAFIESIEQLHSNIAQVTPRFRFGVVVSDTDDNKFTDCAIAGNAKYVVTYDRHFTALTGSGYQPQPISPEDFALRMRTS